MSSSVIRSDQVEDSAVYNREGDKLGSIDHLVIDKESGRIRYVALEFGGFFGVGTEIYPLPWSMLKYDPAKRCYIAPLDESQLESGRRYARADDNDHDDTSGREIHDRYGAPWT